MHVYTSFPFITVCLVLLQYLKLRECEEIKDPSERLRQLQACHTTFKTTQTLEKNAHYVEESVKLLKKQKEIKVCVCVSLHNSKLNKFPSYAYDILKTNFKFLRCFYNSLWNGIDVIGRITLVVSWWPLM